MDWLKRTSMLRVKPHKISLKTLGDAIKLSAKNLTKSIQKRPIVLGVSLEVKPGEAVGLLGPNGAGKTTCFSMIAGLTPSDSGKVEMNGEDVSVWPLFRRARAGLAYLPQESSVFKGLTVEENILAVLEILFPKNIDARHEKLDQLLDEFGITHLRTTSASVLSGGERRRLEIARALAINPKFLLLDEPLAGIDPIAVGDIRYLIQKLKNRDIGVLITDHNVRETLDIVDRAYIMINGEVFAEGTPQELADHQDVKRVYLGERFSLMEN